MYVINRSGVRKLPCRPMARIHSEFVAALLTTFAAPVIRYWLDNLRLKYRLRTEYEYEQRKRLRDLIGHYHGGILNAADIFKTRVFNLYLNEERGWLKVKERKEWFRRTGKDYRGTGYYFTTTAYRFVAVSTWIHRFEGETFYIDSRIAEKSDFDFLSTIKLLQKAATDVTLFKGMGYDDSESKDHFFSDTLRTIANSCWKERRFLSLQEFETKITEGQDLDPLFEVFYY